MPSLPHYIINGEVDRQADRKYKELGIRQMIYTSIEGEEKLFPEYFALPENKLLHRRRSAHNEVIDAFGKIAHDSSRQDADLIGVVVAGWADMGLPPETFWLGYATATSASWNPSADPRELMSSFYTLYFGPESLRMDRVYQLLSFQAQFWSDSWDTVESKARKPIFGNSYGVFSQPRPAKDQTLPLPPIPFTGDASNWESDNARRLERAAEFRAANDELTELLLENMRRTTHSRYALEVFLAINALCRNNLEMMSRLGQMNTHLTAAAQTKEPQTAVRELDEALDFSREDPAGTESGLERIHRHVEQGMAPASGRGEDAASFMKSMT